MYANLTIIFNYLKIKWEKNLKTLPLVSCITQIPWQVLCWYDFSVSDAAGGIEYVSMLYLSSGPGINQCLPSFSNIYTLKLSPCLLSCLWKSLVCFHFSEDLSIIPGKLLHWCRNTLPPLSPQHCSSSWPLSSFVLFCFAFCGKNSKLLSECLRQYWRSSSESTEFVAGLARCLSAKSCSQESA